MKHLVRWTHLIRSDMQKQLMDLQSELKKTIVFITHDLDESLET
jgi:glycine betaine/proline transport system ATP-binding protein